MKLTKLLAAGAASCALVAALGVPTAAFAQDITSSIRGQVSGPSGEPVAGAKVTVTDSRTGATRSTTTDSNGNFSAQNLEPGGPYEVVVDSDSLQGERVNDLFISLGQTSELTFQLDPQASGAADEIIVVASRDIASDLAIGPSATFGEEELADLPSIGRDIRDVIRLDPRVRIDGTNGDGVQCAGSNNRFNSFTVDGVRNADTFGLNASGFQNRNSLPIPFDTIRETSVEFAPYSVEYGQFTGCNINVVTKSGSNEFHGSAFAVYSNQSLNGSTVEGRTVFTAPFNDYNWGATVSGPIIKDKLFFFAGYEEYKDNRPQSVGPVDGGFGLPQSYGRTSQIAQIETLLNARGIPTDGIPSVLPSTSRRILGRIDWNITDDHRAAFTYQRLRERQAVADDLSTTNGRLAFASNFYNQGTESQTYSLRLFSQWTDRLSTELRVSRADIGDIQDPLFGGEADSGSPIPRVIVGLFNDLNADGDTLDAGERGSIVAGPGFSRSVNTLSTQVDQIKAKAAYEAGDHTFTAGYELDQLDAFNLFAQGSVGTLTFTDLSTLASGVLSNGTTSSFGGGGGSFQGSVVPGNGLTGGSFNASFTGNIADAAAEFSRALHSVYIQDEWRPLPGLTLALGVRYDWFDSSDEPRFNPRFLQRYGFSNQQGYNGLDAWLPRFGATYEAGETVFGETTFRLGAGVFTGGDPTVWFSNAYSNPGNLLSGGVTTGATVCGAAPFNVGTSGPLTVPSCLVTAAVSTAANADGRADAVDPNFKVPTVVRANFGLSHRTDFGGSAGGLFDDWNFQFDVIYSRGRNSVDFVDVSLTQTGVAIDGRPVYANVNPLAAGCTATPLGLRQGFANVTAACIGGTQPAAQDTIILTNALQGNRQFVLSSQFAKDFKFDSPLFKNPASFGLSIGYAFTDAEDSNPATSSVSVSNFGLYAASAINANPLATSNFETRHNITANFSYSEEFLKDLKTSFNFFLQARSGQPYSLTFNNSVGTTGVTASGSPAVGPFGDTQGGQRNLLYIPTGPTDPNVSFAPGFDQTGFFNFLSSIGADQYAGGIAPRNAFRGSFFFDLDFRFQQELPGFIGLKPKIFVDVENLLNLVTDESNLLRQRGFPQTANIVTLADPDGAGSATVANPLTSAGAPIRYTYSTFSPTAFSTSTPAALETINNGESLWAAQFGLRFEF